MIINKLLYLFLLILLLSPLNRVHNQIIIEDITHLQNVTFNQHEAIKSNINNIKRASSQVNDQIKVLIEQNLPSTSTAGLFISYLIRANQDLISSFLTRILDEGLASLQATSERANQYFIDSVNKLYANVQRALHKFYECCAEQEHFDIIDQTQHDINVYINEKVQAAEDVFNGLKLKLSNFQTVLYQLPPKFARCLATERGSIGLIPIPLVMCLKTIGADIIAAAPTTLSLVSDGTNANKMLCFITESLIDLVTNRIRATKLDLSRACADVARCINDISIPFCT